MMREVTTAANSVPFGMIAVSLSSAVKRMPV